MKTLTQYQITPDDIDFCDAYSYILCQRLGKVRCDDARQAARLGMVVASHKYDPERSENFKGYATWSIREHLYRDHFGMNCTKSDAMTYSLAILDDACYMGNMELIDKNLIKKDLVEKIMATVTKRQQKVLIHMLNGMNFRDMEKEFGQTHQNYGELYDKARETIRRKFAGEIVT